MEEERYCFCDEKYDARLEAAMFECKVCENWIHFECVNMEEDLENDHVCPGCCSPNPEPAAIVRDVDSTHFERQNGEQCLLQAARMAVQRSDILHEGDMTQGVIAHTKYLKQKYPDGEWAEWCEAWTGHLRGDWKPSDLLRALKASSSHYTWRKVKDVNTTGKLFSDELKDWRRHKQLVLIGYATESEVKALLRKQADANGQYRPMKAKQKYRIPHKNFRKGGQLHAIAMRFDENGDGLILDGAMKGPKKATRFHLDFSLRRLRAMYEISVED